MDPLESARRMLFPALTNRMLAQAADALADDRPDIAEPLVIRFLEKRPGDADALHLMADIARRGRRFDEAESLLSRCVAASPGNSGYRFNHAVILKRREKFEAALAELDTLLALDPRNALFREQKAAILPLLGRHAEALDLRRALVEDYPDWSEAWLHYGQALRRMGFSEDCVTAFRKARALAPAAAGAYIHLSDLKTYRFTADEIEGMQALLSRPEISAEERTRLHYALGKAHGDEKSYSKSFENYAKANALQRARASFDPARLAAHRRNCESVFTPEFLKTRKGWGFVSAAPIFIVGMPRSGSTLVEQILSSHSAIEGLGELPELDNAVSHRLSAVDGRPVHEYWISGSFEFRSGLLEAFPRAVVAFDAADFRALGADYLERASRRRTTGQPHFTDKGLRNFGYAGLIPLILTQARIIDVRRHPLDCGWSLFRSHFPSGLPFAERLADIGQYYQDYVRLMAHFDRVMPGSVCRVTYENLVADPESEIRRLLDYLGLPFEEQCLQFHENKRAVATLSSEQVRRPLYASGMAQWKPYEPWLGPLKSALGQVLETYPP